MVRYHVRRSNRNVWSRYIKSRVSVNLDQKYRRKVRKSWVRDRMHRKSREKDMEWCKDTKWISLITYMKMRREDRRDKIRYIVHVWSLSVHLNQIHSRLNTIIVNYILNNMRISSRIEILISYSKDWVLRKDIEVEKEEIVINNKNIKH